MKSLYKKDSKGKIRIWEIWTENETLFERSGLLNGKLVLHNKTCKGKNIGKANETTPDIQAISEMNSKIKKKLQEDYFLTIDEAENNIVILPMLAKDYEKEKKKVIFPCYAQPKLDGMRALWNNKLTSRKGLTIETLKHIDDTCKNLNTNLILDGELYAKGLSFQDNMKLIKKYRQNESENIKYHVYDLISDEPFITRYDKLKEIADNNPNIELVNTVTINSHSELEDFHKTNIENGFEGTILRWGNDGYKINGRSDKLLKFKDFKDIDCEVIDIIPMEVNTEQGVVVCKYNNITFKATPKLSHKDRTELLTNKHKYIGQKAEIRYFEETDGGVPRFPVCVGFRLDK